MDVKKIRRKRLAQDAFDRKGKDSDQNISASSLNLLTFAVGGEHCVVDHNPNTSQ